MMRCVEHVVIYSVAQRAEQGIVGIVVERHRKSGGEAGRSGEAPIGSQTIGPACEHLDREGPGVTGDERVLLVPCRNCAALSRVEGVELLADAGALIDRLCIRVAQQELRAAVLVTKGGFERVVAGVGNRPVGRIFAVVFAFSDERAAGLSSAGAMDALAG